MRKLHDKICENLSALAGFLAGALFLILCLEPGVAHCAALEINAAGNSASWNTGGVYSDMLISGSARPEITISGNYLTLTGTGNSKTLITGPVTTILLVDGTRLSFGSATGSAGGMITGEIRLLNNGELRVYGGDGSEYELLAAGSATGTVTGAGTLVLGNGAVLNVAGAGATANPLNMINLAAGSSLKSESGIIATTLDASGAGASLVAEHGNISLGVAQIGNNGLVEARAGNLEIRDGLTITSGSARLIAGGNLALGNGADSGFGPGELYARAGGNISLTGLSGRFSTVSAGGDLLISGGSLEGQNLAANTLTLDSQRQPIRIVSENIKVSDIIANGANAMALDAGSLLASGVISGNENLRIDVSGNVSAARLTAGRLSAENLDITSGALSLLGSDASVIRGDVRISGTGAAQNSGVFKNLYVGGKLTVAGSSLSGGALTARDIAVGGSATSELTAESLVGGSITVAGRDSAVFAAGGFNSGLAIAVGKNGHASLGQNSGVWLGKLLAGQDNGGAAAFGLYAPAELSGLTLDAFSPAPVASTGHFVFSPESIFVVNAEKAREENNPRGMLAAKNESSATIANGARLVLEGVAVDSVYRVVGENISVAYAGEAAWGGGNLETTSHLIAARKIAGRDGWFSTYRIPAANVYPDLDPGIYPPLDEGIGGAQLGTEERHFNSPYAGVRFLSRTGSVTYMDHDYRSAVKTMESAVRIAILGGVPQMTLAADRAAMDAGETRASFSDSPSLRITSNDIDGRSFGLWIMPLYDSLNTREWPANNFNYDLYGNLGGVAFGADWTFDSLWRIGLYADAGGSYAKSGGDLAKTTNKSGFGGLGVYAGVNTGDFILAANLHYTASHNYLKQELPASLEMKDPEGELTGRAYSGALKALYRIGLGENWRLLPYAGVRYTYLETDNYTIYSNGPLLDGEKTGQSIWTFPAGLDLLGELATESGWLLRPRLNAGIIPAAGNLSGKSRVRFSGVPGVGDVESQTMDYMRFLAGIGLEVSREGLSLGMTANMRLGQHGEENTLFGVFRYEF